MEDKVKFVSRKLKLKKQTNSVTQILETVHVLIFKLIVLLSFYCKKLNARKCPRVLYDSESSHNCNFIWLILCWPFLYQAWHYITVYYFGGVFTLSFVQYIVLQIVRQNSKRKKLHVVGILRCMKYGSVGNVWFLLWGYIAKNTNSWIKSNCFPYILGKFAVLHQLIIWVERVWSSFSVKYLLHIYVMFTVAINAIHLQNLIHLHKSCTNMDIKNMYTSHNWL